MTEEKKIEAEKPEVESADAPAPEAATAVSDAPEAAAEAKPEGPRDESGVVWGTGRRKSSVARVRVKPGTGRIICNDREFREYFPILQHQNEVLAPLKVTSTESRFDVFANLTGGGMTGQAGAVSLGIARALRKMDRTYEEALRDKHLLTRDGRMKERKKYGLHGARRGVQFSKR